MQQVRKRECKLSDEVLLEIDAPLAALAAQTQHSNVSIALLDTPGPNEHGEEALCFQVSDTTSFPDGVYCAVCLVQLVPEGHVPA